MPKIAALLTVRLTIFKRDSIRHPASLLFLCLMAVGTLFISLIEESANGRGFLVLYFACVNFLTIGSAVDVDDFQIQISRLKIYPLADRMVFRLLSAFELVDYGLLLLVFYAFWLAFLLWPDYNLLGFYLICMGMSYVLLTVLIMDAKLLISLLSPSFKFLGLNVLSLTVGIMCVILFWTWPLVTKLEFYSVFYQFVTDWRLPITSSAVLILISLYRTGVFLVSRYSR